MAVFTLPPEMISFYKKNIAYLTEHAVDPDKKRYIVADEGPKHYIDLDHYIAVNELAFEQFPKKWNDAVLTYTVDTLKKYGIVPWQINRMMLSLTKAFEQRDQERILKLSAHLGHYIADAHVPLHTTENYNGQYTNQKGIHGLWESRLPELQSHGYDYFVGKAAYSNAVLDDTWEAIRGSFFAKDSVLNIEKQLNDSFSKDKKYSYENRGVSVKKVYSEAYAERYHEMLNGMVERRLRKAIIAVGSFWYTAWVNAGQPNLEGLAQEIVSDDRIELEGKKLRKVRCH